MSDEKNAKKFYSLMPLEDFKALMGIDDREDNLSKFCLKAATFAIENYCKRKFLISKHLEYHTYNGVNFFTLGEYPVVSINSECANELEMTINNGEKLVSEYYRIIPDCGTEIDLPFTIELSPAVKRLQITEIKVSYWAGYALENIPADIASACMELAIWNMNRYRGRRVGLTGNIRGVGKEGEHFENTMPENVKALLEPYKRKTI